MSWKNFRVSHWLPEDPLQGEREKRDEGTLWLHLYGQILASLQGIGAGAGKARGDSDGGMPKASWVAQRPTEPGRGGPGNV